MSATALTRGWYSRQNVLAVGANGPRPSPGERVLSCAISEDDCDWCTCCEALTLLFCQSRHRASHIQAVLQLVFRGLAKSPVARFLLRSRGPVHRRHSSRYLPRKRSRPRRGCRLTSGAEERGGAAAGLEAEVQRLRELELSLQAQLRDALENRSQEANATAAQLRDELGRANIDNARCAASAHTNSCGFRVSQGEELHNFDTRRLGGGEDATSPAVSPCPSSLGRWELDASADGFGTMPCWLSGCRRVARDRTSCLDNRY